MARSTLFYAGGKSRNYWGDGSDGELITSGNVTLPSSLDGDIVVRQYSKLTVSAGHTLSVSNRCKGMVLYVHGDCTVDGTISMTRKGANASASTAGESTGISGLKFRRFTQNGSDSHASTSAVRFADCGGALIDAESYQPALDGNGYIYTIARLGANGSGSSGNITTRVIAGGNGGQGGGNGGFGGAGARSSCFSSGPGGGGGGRTPGLVNANGGDAMGNGGAGGYGDGGAGSGAGNPAGANGAGVLGTGGVGENGTGGIIVLLVKGVLRLGASGVIESNGANGGVSSSLQDSGGGGGGASGGGAIMALYGVALDNNGIIRALGGIGGTGHTNGGNGGAGGIIIDQILV